MQKQNLKFQISYFLFILFFTLGAIFYRQPFMTILTLLVIILPIISIWTTSHFSKKLSFQAKAKTASVTTGNDVVLEIILENKGIFSFLNCEADFIYNNLYYPDKNHHCISVSAPAKKTNSIELHFSTLYAGMSCVSFDNFRITDPLHLYTIYPGDKVYLEIPVMPEIKEDNYPLFPAAFSDNDDDEIPCLSGTPCQEIKDIREYRPGDRLLNIHWKMSAKKDELLVKEMSERASRVMVLIPEISEDKTDATVRTLWNYMLFLLKNREIFHLLIYNSPINEFQDLLIQNEDDAYSGFLKLYYTPVYKGNNLASKHFKDLYGDDQHAISICGEEIYLN